MAAVPSPAPTFRRVPPPTGNASNDFSYGFAERNESALNSPTRSEVVLLLKEQPGLNIVEIAARLKLSVSSTRYHLRRLLRAGTIVAHRQGHHRLHFPSSMRPTQRTSVALLRIASIRSLVEAIIQDPVVKPTALATSLGYSARSIRRSLKILIRAGLAREEVNPDTSTRRIELGADLRLAWAFWVSDAGRNAPPANLGKAPSWVLALEVSVAYLVSIWFG